MPRPRLRRFVRCNPNITYFKPQGIRLVGLKEIKLTIDEFEAIRLKDFEQLSQEESAKKMGISQPTFHRLISSARKKVADSIINGKAIRIEGGNFQFRQRTIPGTLGFCVCPSCGLKLKKQRGIPCSTMKCPECEIFMLRER